MGINFERLLTAQKNHPNSLHILDAACHALITRNIFPDKSTYYGLDISGSRLQKAYSVKRTSDILYQANLCHPFDLDGCFDFVVSCNTSHTYLHLSKILHFEILHPLVFLVDRFSSIAIPTRPFNHLLSFLLLISLLWRLFISTLIAP